jgi:MoaA/NifB/PqqE/SkfB family radical SAM enzyme
MNLKGRELYSKVRILDPGTPLEDKNGKEYFRAVCGKTVFTVSPEVAADLTAGKIAEMNLEEGTREVDVDGHPVTVATLAYAGHLSYAQLTNIVKSEGEIQKLEDSYKTVVATAPVDTVA